MKKKFLFLSLLTFSITYIAQTSLPKSTRLFVDIAIYKDKTIKVEGKTVTLSQLKSEVQEAISDYSTNNSHKVTYRIFADRNLKLGYIMDVEQKLFNAYSEGVARKRYLLKTSVMKRNMEVNGSFLTE